MVALSGSGLTRKPASSVSDLNFILLNTSIDYYLPIKTKYKVS